MQLLVQRTELLPTGEKVEIQSEPKSALHVSGDKLAHLQEHFLTIYSFWYNAPGCYRPYEKVEIPSEPKSALHVSGDKLAHLQEHFLTVYTAFGTTHRGATDW